MPRALQARVVLAGLARVGEPALLGGLPCGFVHIERDADLAPGNFDTAADNHIVRACVATVAASFNSRQGQVVEILDGPQGAVIERYHLDRLVKDSGVTRKHIAVLLPPP